MTKREQAEDEVRKKVQLFEEKLNEYNKEVDSFRKKEVQYSVLVELVLISIFLSSWSLYVVHFICMFGG